VVAEVALQLAALDHPLDGSPAHSQRLGGLIEVNEIVFGCRRQQQPPSSSVDLWRDIPAFSCDTRQHRRVGEQRV
jgi:hypothetical protein